MPKETFFNLPEEKRELICRVAGEEFAAYPYAQASINRIVAGCGIAKGSFYQYFANKKDLFLYLLQLAADAKLNYLAPVIENPEQRDFFTLLRELYLAGIQFAVAHPRYAEISKNLMRSKETPLYEEVMESNMPAAYDFFAGLLQNAIGKGEVRDDIDLNLFAYLLASLNTLVLEYYFEYVASDYDEKLLEIIDQFINFLKVGISSARYEVNDLGHL